MTGKSGQKKKQDEKIYNPFRPASQQLPVSLRQSSIIIRLHHHSSCSTINIRAKKTGKLLHTHTTKKHYIRLIIITTNNTSFKPSSHHHNYQQSITPTVISSSCRPAHHLTGLIILTTITSFSLNRTTMSGKPCAPFLFFFKKNPCRNGQGQKLLVTGKADTVATTDHS
jgi:hypothetical protein